MMARFMSSQASVISRKFLVKLLRGVYKVRTDVVTHVRGCGVRQMWAGYVIIFGFILHGEKTT